MNSDYGPSFIQRGTKNDRICLQLPPVHYYRNYDNIDN